VNCRKPPRDYAPRRVEGPLSPRERQVVGCVMEGMLNKQIAGALALTEGSIKVYMNRIFQKTGVHSRTQLAMKMVREG
jgi:DNA-binding NarL/FixJ family response regulator